MSTPTSEPDTVTQTPPTPAPDEAGWDAEGDRIAAVVPDTETSEASPRGAQHPS